MFYPAYNQTVNGITMARSGSGVEIGMERFGAAHTASDREAAIVSIMRDAKDHARVDVTPNRPAMRMLER